MKRKPQLDTEEQRRAERIREERKRRALTWAVIFMVGFLALLSTFEAFITAPQARQEIRDTAAKAKEAAEETDKVADELHKFQAGATAIFCTGQNRGDAVDKKIIRSLLPGAAARDAESGTSLVAGLKKALTSIPPATNCGELICQLFIEIGEGKATIEIQDNFGPDRKRKPCVPDDA